VTVSITIDGLAGIEGMLKPVPPGNVRRGVYRGALIVESAIKANASGRPGPRVQTGDYRRSWNTRNVSADGDGVAVSVGTNRPQARRLEFAFSGADSLGRVYSQPAFPHVEPAIESSRGKVLELIAKEIMDGRS